MSIQRLSNSGQSGYRYKTLIAGITPVASVPVIGEATALTFSTASVTFTAPGVYAGSTFTATSSPGGLTGTSATSPITISGLSEQTAYTFTVTATNATGTSGPSAASNSVTTPAAFTPEGAYDSLATITVPSGGLASITFAGIPNNYKHLQLRYITRNDGAAYYVLLRFNSDTGNNYANHQLSGNGTILLSTANASDGSIYLPRNGSTDNVFGAGIVDILDYANTSRNKTVKAFGGYDRNGDGQALDFFSGLWMNTSAINTVTLFVFASVYSQNSQFTLYGVK